MITFGALTRENINTLSKNTSTPQFTIGFNAPSLNNQPALTNSKIKEENKVSKIIKNLINYNNTNEDPIEENYSNENEIPTRNINEKSNIIYKDDKETNIQASQDDELKVK